MQNIFYIDESIHERGGFILASLIYAATDIDTKVAQILMAHGMEPGKDEYKSSARHDQNTTHSSIRHELLCLLSEVRVGLIVCPHLDRCSLGEHILTGLGKVIQNNPFPGGQITAFVDEGISGGQPFDYAAALARLSIRWQQSSTTVLGLQLADCIAHVLSSMLLENLGLITKATKLGPNTGYDEDTEFTLGEQLSARLRRSFFSQDLIDLDAPHDYAYRLKVGPYGLYAAPSCGDALRRSVYDCFGTTFVGCMH